MVSIAQKGELEFSQVSKVLLRERRGFYFIWIILLPSGNWAQGVHSGTKVLGSHHRAVVWSQRALGSKREEQRRRLDCSPSLSIQPCSFIHLPSLSLPSYLLILLETLVKCCFFPPRTQRIPVSFDIIAWVQSILYFFFKHVSRGGYMLMYIAKPIQYCKEKNKNKIKSHQYFKKSGVLPVTLVNPRYLYFYDILKKFQLIFTIFNYRELKVS